MLAVGLGPAVALVTVALLPWLGPLPVTNPDDLVEVQFEDRTSGQRVPISPLGAAALESALPQFESVATYISDESLRVRIDDGPTVSAAFVSLDFFSVLGAVGREGTSLTGTARSAVVSSTLSPALTQTAEGASVSINGQSVDVLGIVASGFNFPAGTEIWIFEPDQLSRFMGDSLLTTWYSPVVARVSPKTSSQRLQQQLGALSAEIGKLQAIPDTYQLKARSLREVTYRQDSEAARPLVAGGVLFLLLTWTVLFSWQITGLSRRKSEFAVRLALGASLRDLRVGLLLEKSLPAVLGIGATILSASLLAPLAGLELAVTSYRPTIISAFCSVLVVTLTLTALAISTKASRDFQPPSSLAAGRAALIVPMVIALVLPLVLATAHVALSVDALAKEIENDFETDNVWVLSVREDATTSSLSADDIERLVQTVTAAPTVEIAAASVPFFLQDGNMSVGIGDGIAHGTTATYATAAYTQALGLKVHQSSPAIWPQNGVVITKQLGESLDLVEHGRIYIQGKNRAIVGLFEQARTSRLDAPEIVLPITASPFEWPQVSLIVRLSGGGLLTARGVVDQVKQLGFRSFEDDIFSFADKLRNSYAAERFALRALSTLAVIALLIGVTSVLSVTLAELVARDKELAIRMALGASALSLVGLIAQRFSRYFSFGVAVGVSAFVALWRFSSSAWRVSSEPSVQVTLVIVLIFGMVSFAGMLAACGWALRGNDLLRTGRLLSASETASGP